AHTPTDIWAVGGVAHPATDNWAFNGFNSQPLMEHWTGTAWSIVPSPLLPGTGMLWAVAARARDDGWAVGTTENPAATAPRAGLIEHWNGSTWTQVDTLTTAPTGGGRISLWGVVALASDDAWAVGGRGMGLGRGGVFGHQSSIGLIEHWNGSRWSVTAESA